MAQDAILHQCPVCGRPVGSNRDLEDHVLKTHPDDATPDMQDNYKMRREGAGGEEGDISLTP